MNNPLLSLPPVFSTSITEALQQHGTIVHFLANECLYNNNIVAHDMLYFMLTGEVRSFYSIDSGHLLVCENTTGDLLNEEGLYGYGKKSTAIALTDGTAVVLSYGMVQQLLEKMPTLAMLLLKNLSNKVYGECALAA
jgi:CRP-like cAMP-binding protein